MVFHISYFEDTVHRAYRYLNSTVSPVAYMYMYIHTHIYSNTTAVCGSVCTHQYFFITWIHYHDIIYIHTCIYAPFIYSFLFAVSQEGTKLVRVDVIVESDQELLVELKGCGELYHHLPHTLKELGKDG